MHTSKAHPHARTRTHTGFRKRHAARAVGTGGRVCQPAPAALAAAGGDHGFDENAVTGTHPETVEAAAQKKQSVKLAVFLLRTLTSDAQLTYSSHALATKADPGGDLWKALSKGTSASSGDALKGESIINLSFEQDSDKSSHIATFIDENTIDFVREKDGKQWTLVRNSKVEEKK